MKFLKYFSFGVTVVILLSAIYVLLNFQAVSDWWFLRSYTPSGEIAAIANRAQFSDHGKDLFYVSDPVLNEANDFNNNCPFRERSNVLGCFADNRIYIFNVDDPRLDGVIEVTSAHEMLHAAFSRFSQGERDELEVWLNQQLQQVTNQRILDLVDTYRRQDPGSITNEMHSIIGTEVRDLIPELKEHYQQFFGDRQSLVSLSEGFESVFEELEQEADGIQGQISDLKNQISSLESELSSLKSTIDSQRSQLDSYQAEINAARAANDAAAEQQWVTTYNNLVGETQVNIDSFNAKVGQLNTAVQTHNDLVASFNSVIGEQNDLVQSLDSKFESL